MLDYETLRVIWWALLGALLIGFAIMDGFDLGVAALLPVVCRGEDERRLAINTIGPVWEGNQVWLILGAGAIFAAWPALYALAFSAFYLAMLLVLCALILRPVGFKFRGKVADARWRRVWDTALTVGGVVPALVFGVAFGNVLQGVPFRFDPDLRIVYAGGLWMLLNPFALLCGAVSLSMLVAHGGSYLALKTEGALARRAAAASRVAALAMLVLFGLAGFWVATALNGYAVVGTLAHDGPSNPLGKQVVVAAGAWVGNYQRAPWTLAAPLLAAAGALAVLGFAGRRKGLAFVASALACAGVIGTAGVSLFPFLLPSSLEPAMSLTVWDASSSATTLRIMTVVTAVFLPIIILYTSWVYRVLRGSLTLDAIRRDSDAFY